MKDRSSVTVGYNYYEMRFTIAAYEEIIGRLPEGSDVRGIIDYMRTPGGTCEVAEILIRAAEGEGPSAEELKKDCLMIDLGKLRSAAVQAIAYGMGIETADNADVDEDLMEVEKKTPASGSPTAESSPTA